METSVHVSLCTFKMTTVVQSARHGDIYKSSAFTHGQYTQSREETLLGRLGPARNLDRRSRGAKRVDIY